MSAALKLFGRDRDDVHIISTYLQDAAGRIGDMTYLENERRFVSVLNRYCWENDKSPMRVRAALQIRGVAAIQQRNLVMDKPDAVISLLSVHFDAGEAPAGIMRLIFAGGGEIRLEVEACEAILEDITAPWSAISQPAHEDDEPQAEGA